jgi:hypothetical protein
MAAGELRRVEVAQPVTQEVARRLVRRVWLADLLRAYAEELRGHLGTDHHSEDDTGRTDTATRSD